MDLSIPHSHSSPAGVDGSGLARTPPATPRGAGPGPRLGGKMLAVRVHKLDDEVTIFQVQSKALGRVLFEQVCNQLHLLEADYFGLEYEDMSGCKYWLDLEKPMTRQVGLSLVDPFMHFCVKFYTPDPAQLEEEFTRYLFCLQIKRDLAKGDIQCNDNTAALMASYIVQAECGDFVQEDYPDHKYLSSYKFVPHQDDELERRIMENHRKHVGQSPAEADLNLLETARRCELFGMKMHPAKDHEGAPLNLAVAHMGIVVFQNFTKINTFSWAKIRKISFKRKRFLVKLHPEGYGHYRETVEFFFEGRNECKNFWKKCVENHGFFRCSQVKRVPRQRTRVLSRGSSFRYSGKTQKQIVEFVRENYVKRQTFQRDEGTASTPGDVWSQSFRHSSSVHSSVANVGGSISAHPLLPLGDNQVVGTQASLSCGSMTLNSMAETVDPSESLPRRQYHNYPVSMASSTPQTQAQAPRYRTTSLTTSTNTPTHTADIHELGDMDTSPEYGASLTSSPQHFYPQGRAGSTHMEEDNPYQQRPGQPKQSRRTVCTTTAQVQPQPHSYPVPQTQAQAPTPMPPSSRSSTASSGGTIHRRQHHKHAPAQRGQRGARHRSNSMNIEAIIIASVYSTDISNRGLSTSYTRLSSKSTTSVNTDAFNTDHSISSTVLISEVHPEPTRRPPHCTGGRPLPGIALIQASKDSADTEEIEGSDSDAAWSIQSRGRGLSLSHAHKVVAASRPVKRYNWQRSASCKELHHEEVEKNASPSAPDKTSAPPSTLPTNIPGSSFHFESPISHRTEAPVTRYDDSRRVCYSAAGSKTPSLDKGSGDMVAPDQKIYSSSYPGTTSSLSTESEDAGMLESGHGGSVVVLSSDPCGSQDDVSHDSYELLEREADTRSCSLDSGADGEMFAMDDDMEEGYESGKAGFGSSEGGADWSEPLATIKKRKSTGDIAYEMPKALPETSRSELKREEEKTEQQQGEVFSISGMDGKKLVGSVVIDRWGDYRMRVSDPSVSSVSPLPPTAPLPLSPFDSCDMPTGFEMPCTGEDSDRKFKQIKESLKPSENENEDELVVLKQYEADRKAVERSSIDLGESRKLKVLEGKGRSAKESDAEFEDPAQARTQIGRTRSDPHPGKGQNLGRLRRHMLMHQKSIDLPAEAEAKVEAKGKAGKSSPGALSPAAEKRQPQGKSKSDIPYTLHKRHVMNGTAPAKDTKPAAIKGTGVAKSKPVSPPKPETAKIPTKSCEVTSSQPLAEVKVSKTDTVSKANKPVTEMKSGRPPTEIKTCKPETEAKSSKADPEVRCSRPQTEVKSSKPQSEIKSSEAKDEQDQMVPTGSPDGEKSPPSVSERNAPKRSSPPKSTPPLIQSPPSTKEGGKKPGKGVKSPPHGCSTSPPEKRKASGSPSGGAKSPPKTTGMQPQPGKKSSGSTAKSPPMKSNSSAKNSASAAKSSSATHGASAVKTPREKVGCGADKSDSGGSPCDNGSSGSAKSHLKGSKTASPPKPRVIEKPVPVKPQTVKKEDPTDGKPSAVKATENLRQGTTQKMSNDSDRTSSTCVASPVDGSKISPVKARISREVGASPLPIVRKRDRSPVLFGRLGLSEGSAFTPVRGYSSPTSTRRSKSLDAPVVSVHSLPPADSFSSKDDTVDNGEAKAVAPSKGCVTKKPRPLISGDCADLLQDPDVILEVPDEDKSLSPAYDAQCEALFHDECKPAENVGVASLQSADDLSPVRPDSPHPFAGDCEDLEEEELECVIPPEVLDLEIPERPPDFSPQSELGRSEEVEKGELHSTEDDDWASVEENPAELEDDHYDTSVSSAPKSSVRSKGDAATPSDALPEVAPATTGARKQSIQIPPIPQESLEDPLEYARRKMSIEGKPIPQDSLDDVFDAPHRQYVPARSSLDADLMRRKMSIEGKPIPLDPELDVTSPRAKLLSTHVESVDLPSPDFPSPDFPSPNIPPADILPSENVPSVLEKVPSVDYESPDYASPYVQSPDYASPYVQSPVFQSPKITSPKECVESQGSQSDIVPSIEEDPQLAPSELFLDCERSIEEDRSQIDEDLSRDDDVTEESLSRTGDTAQHLLSQCSVGKDVSEPTYVDPITNNTDDIDEKTLSLSIDKDTIEMDCIKTPLIDDDVPPKVPEKPLCLRKPQLPKKPEIPQKPDVPKKPEKLRRLEPQHPEIDKPPETPVKDYMIDNKPPIKAKPAIAKPARLNIVRQNSQEKPDSTADSSVRASEESIGSDRVKILIQCASTEQVPKEELSPGPLPRSPGGRRVPGEEASTSAGVRSVGEKSSTWRPFLLESSGSSSLEEGVFPPDDSAHAGDEDEPSSTSNTRDDEVADIPSGFGYPCVGSSLTMSSDAMMGGYGGVYALSRTLSRISERSTTSEQERSDLEDIEDSTKPSSRSASIDDESLMSSDHQPSLSSDPPSGTCELMPEDTNVEVTAKSVGTPDGADMSCTLVPPRLLVPATSRSASEGQSDYEFGDLPEIPSDPMPLSKDDSTPTGDYREYFDPPGISRYASMESGLDKILGIPAVTEDMIPEDDSDPDLEFHELPALPGENGEEHEETLPPEVLASVIPPPKLSKDSSQSDLPSPDDPVKIFVEGIIPEELRGHIPPPLLPSTSEENTWPSVPSSSPLPVACNVQTYDAGKPEEARKVTVTSSLESNDPPDEAREELSFSDETENPTMQEEEVFDEPLTPSSMSYETLVTVRSRDPTAPRGSTGEDTSMAISCSEWSSSTSTVRQQSQLHTQSGSSHSGPSLHSAHSTHSLSQATSFSQLQQFSQMSQSQVTLASQVPAPSMADLEKADDTSLGASVSERVSSDDVFLTDYGSASSSEQPELTQASFMSPSYLKTSRSQSERSHRSSNYETFHENLYDDDPFMSKAMLSPTERQMKPVPYYPVGHSPTDEQDRGTLSRKRRSKKASSYDTSPKSPTAFGGDPGFDMDSYTKQRSRSIPMKSKSPYYGAVASPISSEDDFESVAARRQALRKSLERPKSSSRSKSHGKSKEGLRGNSRARASHHSARSPPSDYSSSSSENGAAPRASNTIPRVSRRRKQFPSRRRSRAAAEEVRDGRVHGISSAVSTPSVLGYGDPSSYGRRRERREHRGNNGEEQAPCSIKQGAKDVPSPSAPEIPPLPLPESESNNRPPQPKTNGSLMPDKHSAIVFDNRSPPLSPIKPIKDEMGNHQGTIEVESDMKKKRHFNDRAYFIAKEMLMTERTYKKDLSVVNVWFREEVEKEDDMPTEVLNSLFSLIDPIYDLHARILRDLDQRVSTWESCNPNQQQHLGYILLSNSDLLLQLYGRYLDEHYRVLESLDLALRQNSHFEQVYRDFELQKVCYLPLTAFILKPFQRLLHYETLLERLIRHYGPQHSDYQDCLSAKQQLATILQSLPDLLKNSENLVQLCELQRETAGFDSLVQSHREFLRQGCLFKHSRKGYQQRMFFLFSDVLLYTNRLQFPTLHFKVHGLIPLKNVKVEEAEFKMGANFCFTIVGGNRALTLAASSLEERDKWMEDLAVAIQNFREFDEDRGQYLTLKSCSSSDEIIDKCGELSLDREKAVTSPQRSNTTVHVCWHRNTSISMADQLRGVENQLSGFLLRKFKNSNGWQKLWVVFTNFCLFFYKSFQDDSPLASLPLLGYTVSPPVESDGIYKDYVFKLQFKNHVYFFRAESKYTFSRWMEVISSATQHSGRMRLFSRKDSSFERP